MSAIDPNKVAGNSDSVNNFVAALGTNAGLLAIELGVFLVLKQSLWRIYTPRAYLPPPDKRATELPKGYWKWLPALLMSPTEDIIHKNGLDAYMFLRFIKLLIWTFFVFTLVTFAVIIPADAANVSTADGLERISWTNIIEPRDNPRLAAHVVIVYVLTFFVLFMMRREMLHFVHMRHQFLISKSHSRLAQARTVLVTTVPSELANEHDLRTFASFVPGGVDRVWLYRDTKTLNELFEARQDACKKLEAAESQLLKMATQAWRAKEKMHRKDQKRKSKDPESRDEEIEMTVPPASHAFLDELVPPNKRPTHHTGLLGLFGPKVDTIDWCKDDIARLNAAIKDSREHLTQGKFLGSAFIRCNIQMGAHVLAQCVSYHEPLTMYDKWMEAHPKDIVWKNLDDGALEMRSRYVISWLATVGLIVAWAFPVTFIGALSNLDDLCAKVPWLSWVCHVPKTASGIIQGVLPPVLLAILFSLLPFILRALAWYQCIPARSLISVSVYKRFYFFLLIHGFLIVTLSSGITRVTQGLAGAGGALAQLVPLIMHYIRKWFLGRTPRQAYTVTFLMPSADFGVILPRLSLLATIGFAYSVLSPLINILALISYAMFYLAFKFLLTQVFDQPDEKETGGMYFPMAINNLFVGLYIEQICLACLFFLKVQDAQAQAIASGILMLVLFVITASVQVTFNHSFDPITRYLPMSLATKKMAKRYERQKKDRGGSSDTDDEIDLFSRHRIRSVRKRIKATTKKIDNKIDDLKAKVTGDNEKTKSRDGVSDMDALEHANIEVMEKQIQQESQETISKRSKASTVSKESKASSKKSEGPILNLDPATPAATLPDDDSDEEDQDDHAFDHPSTYVDQPWIWIPRDRFGFSELLVQDLTSAGVGASNTGAVMDGKGVVEVTRNPPDEEWTGGHDR
ncbi:hypothetical protein BDQ12DRAFT_701964 [Crucibulum laeve]|uniref:DUF221-domain-containing protein n=1 Tax=Crucibulum laeve TaxID=68775 RepID=A0A5C3MIJ2_9AGAR|nr:hypothetical protein BDQ12DRAFT_701964 [Crucibulum laeve]